MSQLHLIYHDNIAEIKLDNPAKLNAFTVPMLEQMASYLEQIENDQKLRALLVTATGDRAFCAGADIAEWADLTPAQFARHWVRNGHRIFDRLARLSLPTVAVIEGACFGGGLELATACDIRVMSSKASLALPEARVGVVPGWSGSQRLARLLPEAMLKEMALFGRRLTAERAHQAGFVAEISETAFDTAFEMAQAVSALSPRSVEINKWMIHAGVGEDSGALIEALGSAAIAASDDIKEGITAFRGKRPAHFSGD
ncbi:MAG: enoyl-CoA hydratase/isomerase family protein [Candidatus Puniceispirillaceae bacterium]